MGLLSGADGAALLAVSLDVSAELSLPQAAVMVSADTTAVAAAILFMVCMRCAFRSTRLGCLALWVVRSLSGDGLVRSGRKSRKTRVLSCR
jgi:hypothetical protein